MMGQLGEDPAVASRNRAIELVQTQDDGLLTEQKVMMISHFMKDIVVAETCISLIDPEVRRGWILSILGL